MFGFDVWCTKVFARNVALRVCTGSRLRFSPCRLMCEWWSSLSREPQRKRATASAVERVNGDCRQSCRSWRLLVLTVHHGIFHDAEIYALSVYDRTW